MSGKGAVIRATEEWKQSAAGQSFLNNRLQGITTRATEEYKQSPGA
jgi:hypothetical protein